MTPQTQNNQPQPVKFDEAELDFAEMFLIIRRNFKKIFFMTFGFIIMSVFLTLLITPTFESAATISVEETSEELTLFDMGLENQSDVLNNEMEIIKSRTLTENVVQYLWDSNERDSLLLFGLTPVQPTGLKLIMSNLFSFLSKRNMDTLKILEISDEIRDSILTSAVENIRSNMKLRNETNTNVITISLTSPSPEEAALLVNTLIQVYQSNDEKWASGEITSLKEFLLEQINIKESELKVTEDSIKIFQQKEKIYGLDTDSRILLEELSKLEASFYNIQADINILKERKKYIENRLTEEEIKLVDNLTNTLTTSLSVIHEKIADAESERLLNIIQYGEDHEAVQNIQNRLETLKITLKEQTDKLIEEEISATDPLRYRQTLMDSILVYDAIEAGLITTQIEQKKLILMYESQLNQLPEKLLNYTRLQRLKTIQEETYGYMVNKLEEAKVTRASELGKIRIIDPAIASIKPIKPKLFINVFIGIILGGFLGLILVFFIELLDNTVKNIDEIERKGLSILTIIPSIGAEYKRSKKRKRKNEKGKKTKKRSILRQGDRKRNLKNLQRRLITHELPNSPISEAYRLLRTTLMYANTKEKGSILITSAGQGEGKTTTIANLAITYANFGKRTLLIDSDLRKSVIHKVFNIKRENGITEYLSGQIENHNSIIKPTEVENLFVVTSGATPPNPSELLGSEKMLSLIKQFESEWDVILFDSPPLLAVTDANMVAKHILQFILVIRPGVTDKSGLKRTLINLNQMNIPVTGVVFNGVTESNTYGYNYYHSYYYQYFSEED